MTTSATTPHPSDPLACPTPLELSGLIHGDLSSQRQDELTGHVSSCVGCQEMMEALATGEHSVVVEAVRDIDRHEPPRYSALWRVIESATVSMKGGNANTIEDGNGSMEITQSSVEIVTVDPDAENNRLLDFLQPTSTPNRIGRIDRFDVIEVIGRGGMGVVLRAFDPSLQREVAVKVLDPQLASNAMYRQRFCREARSAASVSHDNIVAVHQVEQDEASGLPFLVMQLVSGESLEQRLRRVGRLSVPEVIRLGAQAAAGLAAAHAVGLIHRDVKPGNMLIEAGTDRLKLTDFGLARATEDMKLTKTGFVSGTPLYMAPEQACGDDVDHRADLFSLGVVLYEALAGKPPFDGKTPLAVLRRVADEPHPPLGEITPDIPEWLEDVIDGLLTKKPEDRFSTAADVAVELGKHVPQIVPADRDLAVASPCTLSTARSNLSRTARRKLQLQIALLILVPFVLGTVVGAAGFWFAGPSPSIAAVELSSPIHQYAGNSGAVWSVSACPDGHTLAMGLEDGRIIVYDVSEKKVRTTLDEHHGPVWGVEFFPDAKRFVSASEDTDVKVWEIGNRKSIRSLPHGSGVRAIALRKDGELLVTGGRDGTVTVWNLNEQKPITVFSHGSSVNAVAFAMDGKSVATAGADKTVKLWDISKGSKAEQRLKLEGHKGPIYSVAFSPNQEDPLVATAGWDSVIRIWDSSDGSFKKELTGHEFDIWSLSFCPAGTCLTSGGGDGTVRIWDVESGKQLSSFQAHKPVAHVVRFARDGQSVFSGGRDGFVRQWDLSHK